MLDEKFKSYMPDLESNSLPEREFFFGVIALTLKFFIDCRHPIW
jgi:hypothetical protein